MRLTVTSRPARAQDGRAYDLVLCSFSLHLLEASYLHTTLSALARCVARRHTWHRLSTASTQDLASGLGLAAPRAHHHRLEQCAPVRSARLLLIATPHKRPHVAASTGWEMLGEVVRTRVRVRLYSSTERAT